MKERFVKTSCWLYLSLNLGFTKKKKKKSTRRVNFCLQCFVVVQWIENLLESTMPFLLFVIQSFIRLKNSNAMYTKLRTVYRNPKEYRDKNERNTVFSASPLYVRKCWNFVRKKVNNFSVGCVNDIVILYCYYSNATLLIPVNNNSNNNNNNYYKTNNHNNVRMVYHRWLIISCWF